MQRKQLKAAFDQQAAGYDKQQEKMAPILNALRFVLESIFADVPIEARILSVGVGTGAELSHLALRFPQWSFTVVEPSGSMLDICRRKAEKEGFASRCLFHEGYVESLPLDNAHDAATCFLVSQFIIEQEARSSFFNGIANRLKPNGILASADLASGVSSGGYESLMTSWLNMMKDAGVPAEGRERMREAYSKDVAVLPAATVASIIESGGFETPVQFFQAGLFHAWLSKRASNNTA